MPVEPSVGSHWGKQSRTSVSDRLRMITLSAFFTTRLPPVMPAPVPGTPMTVVRAGTVNTIRAACLAWAALRAFSWAPEGTLARPQTAGS